MKECGYGRLVYVVVHASARVDEDGKRGNAPILLIGGLRKYTPFVYILLNRDVDVLGRSRSRYSLPTLPLISAPVPSLAYVSDALALATLSSICPPFAGGRGNFRYSTFRLRQGP